MGQYQQWLHYREIDQQLQAHLRELSDELAKLQAEQARLMEPHASLANNAIIQALTKQGRADQFQSDNIDFIEVNDVVEVPDTPFEFSPFNGVAEEYHFAQIRDKAGDAAQQHAEAVSPALFAWSSLPNFDSGKIPIPDDKIPSTPHPDTDLLPEDMNMLMKRGAQDDPQLPWLQPEGNEHGHNPVDQQSKRTDRLVQRWLARWGRETDNQPEQGGGVS